MPSSATRATLEALRALLARSAIALPGSAADGAGVFGYMGYDTVV